jgi:hypothetical protein
VKNQGTNKFKFNNSKPYYPYVLVICIILLFSLAGFTLAFFFESDWSNKTITLSGKVQIEAVGKSPSYSTIEDTASQSMLDITLSNDDEYLIPGADIYIDANCKVFQSTTSPLLRASVTLAVYDAEGDIVNDSRSTRLLDDMNGSIQDNLASGSNWSLYDGYFYYTGGITQDVAEVANYELKPIQVLGKEFEVIHFIDEPIKFPEFVDSTYSGLEVRFVIVFQAIQDFIPNAQGEKLDTTIINSLTVFNKLAPMSVE